MLNHVKKGMERTYDQYAPEDEKRDWFAKREREIAAIAFRNGLSDALGIPARYGKLVRNHCAKICQDLQILQAITNGSASPNSEETGSRIIVQCIANATR